jgi:hypothetical protein
VNKQTRKVGQMRKGWLINEEWLVDEWVNEEGVMDKFRK